MLVATVTTNTARKIAIRCRSQGGQPHDLIGHLRPDASREVVVLTLRLGQVTGFADAFQMVHVEDTVRR